MLNRTVHLRRSAEFRLVYERGRRFDGRLMTVFVLENRLGNHRFGVTASRKMSKNAVLRNRAKRLLRETFRLSSPELKQLIKKYDWVVNARRSLLVLKLEAPFKEFQKIVAQLSEDERRNSTEAASG